MISTSSSFNYLFKVFITLLFVILSVAIVLIRDGENNNEWHEDEIAMLGWLSLDLKNQTITDGLSAESQLGKILFFDRNLSKDGNVSCSSCHDPDFHYGDPYDTTRKLDPNAPHRAPGLEGVSNQMWFFWDGRTDSLWSQALSSLENPSEHASSRLQVALYLCDTYYAQYPSLLSPCGSRDILPVHHMAASPNNKNREVVLAWERLSDEQKKLTNELFILTGKTIASFVKTLQPKPSRFDAYVYDITRKNNISSMNMSKDEVEGLRLFLKTGCVDCHNGSMFTNSGFFAIGTDISAGDNHDRQDGIKKLLHNEFNCLQQENKDDSSCAHVKYLKNKGTELVGAYKVPSLRNIKSSVSFMHDGRFNNLSEVIDHYSNPNILPLRHLDVRPLRLFKYQKEQLISFLIALNEPYTGKDLHDK
ncbi:cytochrome-c peroxidase [Aeromonas sp. 600724]|uniref:cytochrome-c peroxidase n=1 Tax=Aeromonas sp. 600724 TaxID=2712031 RepID=UPI0038EEFA82